MQSTLLSLFSEIADPRRGQGKMYPLPPDLLNVAHALWNGALNRDQILAYKAI